MSRWPGWPIESSFSRFLSNTILVDQAQRKTVDHEQQTTRSTSDSDLCATLAGVCCRLGGAIIWRSTVASRALAALSCTVWRRWLTPSYQCTSFSASVLANAVRPSCRSWPMAMADTQATFDLVCADSSCGCFDRRLAGDGLTFPASWPVDDGRDRENVRFPVGSLYGFAADPTVCRKCCRVAEKQTSSCQRFHAAWNRISTGSLVAFGDVLRRDPRSGERVGLTTSDDFRYNVLVVNNGSTETTLALIKRPKPTITQRGVGVLDSSSFEQSSSSSIPA